MSQQEIARVLDVSAKTISRWATDGKWEQSRLAKETTNQSTIADLRHILHELVQQNKEKLKSATLTKADADMVIEYTKAIESLEGSTPLRHYVQILEELMNYSDIRDKDFRTKLAQLQNNFLIHVSKNKK